MPALSFPAAAKLNLTLHLTGRRANGYHEIEGLVVFTEYGDHLMLAPADAISLTVNGPFASGLQGVQDNLVMRAARALQPYAKGQGAHITLTKNLPVGSGIGGGSSDAAAALKGLAALWNIVIPPEQLEKIALGLGSDVPVCLRGQPSFIGGLGEIIRPCKLAVQPWVLLCNPRKELLTATVYQRYAGGFARPETFPAVLESLDELQAYTASRHNMLEEAAIECLPQISDIKLSIAQTQGCMLARMSGSGATCFGLYKTEPEASAAQEVLQQKYPGSWTAVTKIPA